MKRGLLITLVILGILIVLALGIVGCGASMYNSLVRMNEQVNNAWGQVQNQYQRRLDLIPNLVNTVKGYATHEASVFENVAQARSNAGKITLTPEILNDPQAFARFQQAQGELTGALSRLLAVAENYPQLKANENFLQLQSQLEGTENRIAVERMRFNEVVQNYNVKVKTFPTNMFAGLFGFGPKAYFQSEPGAEKAPKVQF